jgi:hypothetical protein
MTGENVLHAFVRHELGRLNTSPAAELNVGVLDGLDVQRVRINDQEVRASTEAGINIPIQRRLVSCDRDSHQIPSSSEGCRSSGSPRLH